MNYYRHYKVRYIDKWSKGVVRETEIHGYYDLQGVKNFFGLDGEDVDWYEIEEIKK